MHTDLVCTTGKEFTSDQFSFLIFGVKKFYFRVLAAEKLRKVAKEAVNQVGAHLEVVENFFREGMVPEVDVLKAKVVLANAKQNLINANNVKHQHRLFLILSSVKK